jgi:isopentenyl-diphosphate delta-isomerase
MPGAVHAPRVDGPRAGEGEGDPIVIPAIAADGSYFPIGKMRAHREGLQHLAVSVFVFAGDELLIQRRAAAKYHCALQWANTCCTHPYWNEPVAKAAPRRLFEELGIAVPLTAARIVDYCADVTNGLTENERVHVFKGVADRARLHLAPDPDEVCETRWARVADLRREAAATPAAFAPWFRIYLARWNELGL